MYGRARRSYIDQTTGYLVRLMNKPGRSQCHRLTDRDRSGAGSVSGRGPAKIDSDVPPYISKIVQLWERAFAPHGSKRVK